MKIFIGHKSNRLTSLGNDNVGGLSFTYGLETDDTVGNSYVFNAHDASWITFCRGLFGACQTMYRNRESAGCFNSVNYLKKVKDWQDTRPERVWVADAQRKYLRPYEDNGTVTYIPMLAGRKTHQREQVKTYNAYYYASKYVSDFCTSQNIMVRGNTPTEWSGIAPANTATLSMYINCYIVVASTSYNVVAKTKAVRGQSYVMDFSTIGSMGETELYFCTAPMITELSGLAHLYFKQNNFAMGTNLQRLEIGSDVEGYSNPNLESLTIGNNRMLEYLDIRNCPNATGALDLSGCLSLKELYLDNTAFTGITFATGGLLETAHLPNPTSISMRELIYLNKLLLESASNLSIIRVEDCVFDDDAELTIGSTTTKQSMVDIVLNLINSSSKLTAVRLMGIDWLLGSSDVLNRLLAMDGIDEDNHGVSQSILTGQAYINGPVRIRELNSYSDAWEYFDVTYNPNELVEQYAATYVNDDGTELCSIYVDRGSNPPDPVATGEIQAPTKASDAQYTYTFGGWNEIESIMLAPRTIIAAYTPTIRTYTVTWYSRPGVPLRTVQTQYGTEVVYEGDRPTRTDEESSYTYNVFAGWDKSTGYITGDTDVYAIWDRSTLPTSGTLLNNMTPAQIYGLGNASGINIDAYINDEDNIKDYKDITVGHDFSFDNVESTLICSEQYFNGTSDYLDTDIKLFDADSNSFTLAIDFEFVGTTNNRTLVSCFEENGSEGFRLRYNNGSPSIQWGDKNQTVGATNHRGICVLRHLKGSDTLYVYAFNLNGYTYDANITFAELVRNRSTSTEMPLVFGAVKASDGGHINYAQGWIHWCKIWYADLGDVNARELAAWPHETWRMEYTGSGERFRVGYTSQYARLSFIANSLLDCGYFMNNNNTNAGGFPDTELYELLNTRVFNALPTVYQSILKKVSVKSSAGNNSTEIVAADTYIYVPSVYEVTANSTSPYPEEGEKDSYIAWFTNSQTRSKYNNINVPDGSRAFTSSEDPTTVSSNNVISGDVWYTNSMYYIYISADDASKHVYSSINQSGYASTITASNGGLWLAPSDWWLRSPMRNSSEYFHYVSYTGNMWGYGYPYSSFGIDVCFSV